MAAHAAICVISSALLQRARALRRNQLNPLDTSYCNREPDHDCYKGGKPACCLDSSIQCPEIEPPCDKVVGGPYKAEEAGGLLEWWRKVGTSYCTHAPSFHCYEKGWPACCLGDKSTCPTAKPACDKVVGGRSTRTRVGRLFESKKVGGRFKWRKVGTSYCTHGPSFHCYAKGWPACCLSDQSKCPTAKPACDKVVGGRSKQTKVGRLVISKKVDGPVKWRKVGTSYCTHAPSHNCYEKGWPACCLGDKSTCPTAKPACDKVVGGRSKQTKVGRLVISKKVDGPVKWRKVGTSYCTHAPSHNCYEKGWPACCLGDKSTCPTAKPACDKVGGGRSKRTKVGRRFERKKGGGRFKWRKVGASYCTHAPFHDCYERGLPACCLSDQSKCPRARPRCDKVRRSKHSSK
eukprot:TRINITY_DN3340_c0_g1_i2.p1 TRINITY_DN3340_c0_g1~~TRINITY_DN3340_c0_g1_i2.p1  ORF type:complete len:404 (-),score=14.26 TRINITY_DN3340_c0_g1_i2:35-1246(-)